MTSRLMDVYADLLRDGMLPSRFRYGYTVTPTISTASLDYMSCPSSTPNFSQPPMREPECLSNFAYEEFYDHRGITMCITFIFTTCITVGIVLFLLRNFFPAFTGFPDMDTPTAEGESNFSYHDSDVSRSSSGRSSSSSSTTRTTTPVIVGGGSGRSSSIAASGIPCIPLSFTSDDLDGLRAACQKLEQRVPLSALNADEQHLVQKMLVERVLLHEAAREEAEKRLEEVQKENRGQKVLNYVRHRDKIDSIDSELKVCKSKLSSAERKAAEAEEGIQCLVCMSAERCVVFFPCCHFATCQQCASDIEEQTRRNGVSRMECPFCRGSVSSTLSVLRC
jgi:hypothetical protein